MMFPDMDIYTRSDVVAAAITAPFVVGADASSEHSLSGLGSTPEAETRQRCICMSVLNASLMSLAK